MKMKDTIEHERIICIMHGILLFFHSWLDDMKKNNQFLTEMMMLILNTYISHRVRNESEI